MCPVGKNLWVSFQKFVLFKLGLNLQNQVSGFSKSFGLFKSGLLAVVIFQNFIGLKIGSCFCFKKFRVKFAQVSKIGFKVLAEILVSKRFHFAKPCFYSKGFFLQSQVYEIDFKIFSKSFVKFCSGFFAEFIFSGKVHFLQSQFLAWVSASSRLWRFEYSKLISLAKSGL